VNDAQTDDEKADAHEDLDAAFLCLVANFAGGGEKEHERERVQAVHEPVRLGLREREHERDGGDGGENACCGSMIATGIAAATPSAVPMAFPLIRSRFPIRT
jgi:hypothetical protein